MTNQAVWRDSLLKWTRFIAPSGSEHALVQALLQDAAATADATWSDALGNGYAQKDGQGPHVLICAPVDEPGVMVLDVDADGHERVAPIGPDAPAQWAGRLVRFVDGTVGLLLRDPQAPADRWEASQFSVDVAAGLRESVPQKLSVGLAGVIGEDAVELGEGSIAGRAVGPRAAVTAALAAYAELAQAGQRVTLALVVQRQTGHRGIRTVVQSTAADLTIVVEPIPIRPGGDEPRLGGGPVVRLRDPLLVLPQALQQFAERVASEAGRRLQRAVLTEDGSDAGTALRIARMPVIGVGMPVLAASPYAARVQLEDVDETARLVAVLGKRADTLTAERNML